VTFRKVLTLILTVRKIKYKIVQTETNKLKRMSRYSSWFGNVQVLVVLISCAVARIGSSDVNSIPPAGCTYEKHCTINCSSSELTRIPDGLNPQKRILIMQHSKRLTTLTNDSFLSVNLTRLLFVDLSDCAIERIELKAFRGLEDLATINLSKNKIRTLELGMFEWTANLENLYLWGNPIVQLSSSYSTHKNSIQYVDLDFCHMSSFPHRLFSHLIYLNLKIWIQKIKKAFIPLTKLKNITLDGNPLICDCDLKSFKKFLIERGDTFVSSMLSNCDQPYKLENDGFSIDLSADSCSYVPFEITQGTEMTNIPVKTQDEERWWETTRMLVVLTVILGLILIAQTIGFLVWRMLKRAKIVREMSQVRIIFESCAF
jgi:hypothetical protein